uniref:Eukaryotic translation initiation factor 3 subunit C N-terminal domain-containing protein n=1 Tax=Apteryx owenii TaxID=8824 RepID=A0A8B9PZQ0_APTOW
MNKNNAKALSTLRQKIRKYNRDYESHIASYKQNPEQSADEDEERKSRDSEGSTSSSEDEDDEGVSAAVFLKKKDSGADSRSRFLKKMDEDEEEESDDDEDWGSSDSDTDSESDEDEGKYTSLASKFLKKDEDKKSGEKKREEKAKKKHDRKARRYEDEDEDNEGGEWEKVKGGVPLVKEQPKMFAKGTEINHAVVVKKLNEILQARGKKGTDRAAQIELLQLLVSIANENNLGVALEVKIKFNIIASLYDYNPNLATYMKPEMWQKCLDCIEELLDILFANPDIFIGENIVEESENLSNAEQPYRVRGCILTLVERMDEEFTKIMQNTDPHSQEYVDHLKDEGRVCAIIARLQSYLQEKGTTEELCRVFLRRVLHTYYKFDYKAHQRQQGPAGDSKSEADQAENEGEDSAALMERLCKYIYAKDRTDRIRTCAILCHIYHHALHSRWYQARDLMLMSHLQDNIHHADPPVQVPPPPGPRGPLRVPPCPSPGPRGSPCPFSRSLGVSVSFLVLLQVLGGLLVSPCSSSGSSGVSLFLLQVLGRLLVSSCSSSGSSGVSLSLLVPPLGPWGSLCVSFFLFQVFGGLLVSLCPSFGSSGVSVSLFQVLRGLCVPPCPSPGPCGFPCLSLSSLGP